MDDADKAQTEKIQKELDAIMLKDKVVEVGNQHWAPLFWHKIWLGIFAIIGVSVLAKLLATIGLPFTGL